MQHTLLMIFFIIIKFFTCTSFWFPNILLHFFFELNILLILFFYEIIRGHERYNIKIIQISVKFNDF